MKEDLEARLDSDTTTLLDGTITINDEEVPLRRFEFLRLAIKNHGYILFYDKDGELTEIGEAYYRDLNLAANKVLGTEGKDINEVLEADYELPDLVRHKAMPLIERNIEKYMGGSEFFAVAGIAYLDDLTKSAKIALDLPEIEKLKLKYDFEVVAQKGKVQYLYADNRLVIFKPGLFRDKLIMYEGIDRETAVKIADLHKPKLSLKTKLGVGAISTLESILLLGLEAYDSGLWDKSMLELGLLGSLPFFANYALAKYLQKRKIKDQLKNTRYYRGQVVIDRLEGKSSKPKPWYGTSLAITSLFFAVVGTYIAKTAYNIVQKKDYVASLEFQDTALDPPKNIKTLTNLLSKSHLNQQEFMEAYEIIFEHIFGVGYNEDYMPIKFVKSMEDLNIPPSVAIWATGIADIMSNTTFLRVSDTDEIPISTLKLAIHELGHQIDPEFRDDWLSTIVNVTMDYLLTSNYQYENTDYAKRFETRADTFKVLIGLEVLRHGGISSKSSTKTPTWDPALALEGEDNYLWQKFNKQDAYTFANTIIQHLQLLNRSEVDKVKFVYENSLTDIIDTIREAYTTVKK